LETIATSGPGSPKTEAVSGGPKPRGGANLERLGVPWTRHVARGALAGLFVFLLIVGGTALVSFLLPKAYLGEARITVGGNNGGGNEPDASTIMGSGRSGVLSAAVLNQVASELNLKNRWRSNSRSEELSDIAVQRLLLKRVEVKWDPRSRLLYKIDVSRLYENVPIRTR